MKKYFSHKTALVETKSIGAKTTIWAFTHVLKGAVVGRNVNINDHCFIEGGVTIGNNVTIKAGVYLWDGITVEDNVQVGPGVVFTNDKYPRAKNKNFQLLKTTIKKGASVGGNATIIGGTTIGEYAMIGAGAVVTKDIPAFHLVFGNPAKTKGYVCACGKKLKFTTNKSGCSCGRTFQKTKTSIHQLT